LQRRADEGDASHGLQILEGELQAQGEEQQRHADFGQQFDVVERWRAFPARHGG
jgi:hypothetical protein